MKIILASASPRRKELLEQIDIPFEIKVSDVEEVVTTNVPHLLVQELSAQKALAVMDSLLQEVTQKEGIQPKGADDFLVIGADTVVACDGKILGKPKSRQDAIEMLTLLQGREHQVYTGVTLLAEGKAKSFYEATIVNFYPMTPEEILEYVGTKNPGTKGKTSKWDQTECLFDCEDKAGSYGIQGFCARYISGIEGDYNNVVGLPVGRLYQELREFL